MWQMFNQVTHASSVPHHLKRRGSENFIDFLNRGIKKLVLEIGGLKVKRYVNREIKSAF